jgi:hypothetical protein
MSGPDAGARAQALLQMAAESQATSPAALLHRVITAYEDQKQQALTALRRYLDGG